MRAFQARWAGIASIGVSYFLLGLFGVTVATIGLWRRSFRLRLALAAFFLVAQLLVLALLIDVHAHVALKAEIAKRGPPLENSHVITKNAEMQGRGSAGLVTLGLFLLAVVPPKVKDRPAAASPQARCSGAQTDA